MHWIAFLYIFRYCGDMKVGVIGGSGYAGGELLRLIALHPHFELSSVSAHSNAGEEITSIHPQLQSYQGRKFASFVPSLFDDCELIFIALPHGESAALISQLPHGAKIVDLGADFRLENEKSWKKYYGGEYAGSWPYGLPELNRNALVGQNRIANPGCYATAIALGAAPAASIADTKDIVVVAASGTTGAGRSAKINLLASEVMGSMSSYKFGGVHQHTPEIEECIARATGKSSTISFTPVLAPQPRGILATLSMKSTSDVKTIRKAYMDFYKDEEFVTVLPEGVMPKTNSVTGSNHVHIQVAYDEHAERLVVSVVLDNLGKGAAAQAIQNANIISGLPENSGLEFGGIGS